MIFFFFNQWYVHHMARSLETAWLLDRFNHVIKDQSSFHFSMLPFLCGGLVLKLHPSFWQNGCCRSWYHMKNWEEDYFFLWFTLPFSKIPSRISPIGPNLLSCPDISYSNKINFPGTKEESVLPLDNVLKDKKNPGFR